MVQRVKVGADKQAATASPSASAHATSSACRRHFIVARFSEARCENHSRASAFRRGLPQDRDNFGRALRGEPTDQT